MTITPLKGRIYRASPFFADDLKDELGAWNGAWGGSGADESGAPSFFYTEPGTEPVFWFQNSWLSPVRIEFNSISEAVSALRSMQRNWAADLFTQFRRGALISAGLPPVSPKPRPFPWTRPDAPMGSWTLLDAHTMLASQNGSSPFPGGVIHFVEDKYAPPSRAYLKLWEALALCRKWPLPGERCLDAGASPGGWTWALAKLGAEVSAVDRAPLETRVGAMPGVRYIKHDAFTLKPEDIGRLDWLVCDVVCYPDRLCLWIEKWLESGLCGNFICTLKMQGRPDRETILRFAAIPGSKIVHLFHNKHELTWIKV
jgi:23S rRNA (cytidine2498-2'-O)-methyltransferase